MGEDATQIDLGDDLLAADKNTQSSDFYDAKILVQEGFLQDAKKILRKLLSTSLRDEVRALLAEISDREQKLDQVINSDELMRRLDAELRLGIFAQTDHHELVQDVFRALAGCSFRTWMDLSIGFVQMEEPQVARALLEHMAKRFHGESMLMLEVSSVLAQLLVAENDPYAVIVLLQTLLGDADIPEVEKVDLHYWMGRACELIGNAGSARQYYERVRKAAQNHRDVHERLQE